MLDFDAICRGRMHFWRSVRAFRSWLWTLFVVAGHRLPLHAFLQKSTLNAICGVPEHLAILLFAFDAWFWCYLWCSNALGHFIVCLRCLIWTLFVVAGRTSGDHCFSSMLDFDAICRFWGIEAYRVLRYWSLSGYRMYMFYGIEACWVIECTCFTGLEPAGW